MACHRSGHRSGLVGMICAQDITQGYGGILLKVVKHSLDVLLFHFTRLVQLVRFC